MAKRKSEDRAWLLYTTPMKDLPCALRERLQGFECGEDSLQRIRAYLAEIEALGEAAEDQELSLHKQAEALGAKAADDGIFTTSALTFIMAGRHSYTNDDYARRLWWLAKEIFGYLEDGCW